MKFTKMHGCGNDYVYVNCLEETVKHPDKVAQFVSDRHFGIGSDGLILIEPSEVADFCMAMYNADGSRGEMCGNGIRCVAKYVYDYGLTDKTQISVETLGGIKYLDLTVEDGKVSLVKVDMGKPELEADLIPIISEREQVIDEPIEVDGKEYHMTGVSMGNPHDVVFMDAIHYHVRSEGRIVKRAVYIALGIDMNGKKDVLGMYVGENESAKFWLSIMNGLKNRGVSDILIACVDGLNGFPQAIEAVYPNTEIQQCIIHQIRNATKFVSYKDIKKLMSDLKRVYAAPTEEIALNELELFKDKWDSKYPKIYKSWHDNWATLSTYFKYPEAVRRLIYTTNAIEGFNRQLRKVTKSKTVFPSDDSLLKMLYLATMDITKKWTGHRQDWGQIHSQLEIYFEERLAGRNL